MSVNLKKILLTTGLILTIGANNQVQKTDLNQATKELLKIEYESRQITIRKGIGTTYNVSKSQAEKSLDALCRNKKIILEDAWMHYNNILIDIGMEEKPDTVRIFTIPVLIQSYSSNIDTITLYHTHPALYDKNNFCPQSIWDIISHARISAVCNPKTTLIGKVFDGSGMWEMELDEGLVSRINKNKESLKNEYIRIEYTIQRNYSEWHNRDYSGINFIKWFTKSKENKKIRNKHINQMRQLGVELKYTPSDSIK
jgi:hypothetical protein